MDARTLLAGAVLAAAIPVAAQDAQERRSTPADDGIRQVSGTATNAATSPPGDAGGTGVGSGTDTSGAPGLAVGEGTVMRPLSAQGRNGLRAPDPARRKQLYGLNPKAADAAPARDSTR